MGPEVLLSSTSNAVQQSDSEEDLQSEPSSPVDDNFRYGSPDRDLNRDDSGDQELSEEASYRYNKRHEVFHWLAQDPQIQQCFIFR